MIYTESNDDEVSMLNRFGFYQFLKLTGIVNSAKKWLAFLEFILCDAHFLQSKPTKCFPYSMQCKWNTNDNRNATVVKNKYIFYSCPERKVTGYLSKH